MGMFDTVLLDCPRCGAWVGYQSKQVAWPDLDVWRFDEAPPEVQVDANGARCACDKCGQRFVVRVKAEITHELERVEEDGDWPDGAQGGIAWGGVDRWPGNGDTPVPQWFTEKLYAVCKWTNASGDRDFMNPKNWAGNRVPVEGDMAFFPFDSTQDPRPETVPVRG
ncbi:MAG: hypothetical protein ACX94C_11655 [Phycisphaerales bacterium]